MKKYVVAVSGGVDSMVLLDMMAKKMPPEGVVVAHFDHGMRPDSRDDALFVADAAARYGLDFEMRREELGAKTSEEVARARRYEFLWGVAKKHHATLVTAHHLDDLVETVAINLTRGTGWRGLAPFSHDIFRPLIALEKQELIAYARDNNLTWHEDSTNQTDAYLRNRIRRKAHGLPLETKRELLALYARQRELRLEVEQLVKAQLADGQLAKEHQAKKTSTKKVSANDSQAYARYRFIQVPTVVALEYLYAITEAKLTRPQMQRALHAIKVAQPGTVFQAGNNIQFHFSTRHFSV